MISDIEADILPFLLVDLKIAHHLLKRKLKRIADIVEQRCQSPVLQETVGCFS